MSKASLVGDDSESTYLSTAKYHAEYQSASLSDSSAQVVLCHALFSYCLQKIVSRTHIEFYRFAFVYGFHALSHRILPGLCSGRMLDCTES